MSYHISLAANETFISGDNGDLYPRTEARCAGGAQSAGRHFPVYSVTGDGSTR